MGLLASTRRLKGCGVWEHDGALHSGRVIITYKSNPNPMAAISTNVRNEITLK